MNNMSANKQHIIAAELLTRHSNLNLEKANEANTRIKLIDRILYEVLGWTHDDVSNEETVNEDDNTTYADYIIKTANSAIVVEAKKIGDSFKFPATSKRRIKLDRRFVDGATGEAITQAREYSRKKGIPFAVVTNGHQWILYPATRTDGVSFKDSYAIVFDSLDSALGEDFDDFTSLLSREGVIAGNLESDLIGRNEDQLDERRLGVFYTMSAPRPPNPIFPLIQSAVEYAFTDSVIDKEESLLKKCYVLSSDRIKFDSKIKMHLQRKESLFSQIPKRPLSKKTEQLSLNESLDRATAASRPIAILVLGQVGAGKSTFLHYTRMVSAKEYFAPKRNELYPHWINVDFRKFTRNEDPKKFIYNTIRDYIDQDELLGDHERCIKPAYAEQINALMRGLYKPLAKDEAKRDEFVTNLMAKDYEQLDPYIEKIIKWISSKVPLFLVIDNLDQFESPDTQSNIFADCLALSSKFGCNIIVSMRESTYIEHRHRSVLDAFDFDPIQIDAPEIKPVLSKRFQLAGALLKDKQGDFRALNGAAFSVSDLSLFMQITQKSVLGTEVGEFIELLASGNVRFALKMTRDFLSRGYTDPAKALNIESAGKSYTLPRHEAIRALLTGDRQNYSEEYSSILNPFDSRLAKNSAQLLRLYVLSALAKMSSIESFRSLDGETIISTLESIGFPADDVLKVLTDLCNYSCIATLSHEKASKTSSYYPTRLGGHLVRKMIGDFNFVENVMVDTFISDTEVWAKLRDFSAQIRSERDRSKKLVKRVDRVKVFHQSMNNQFSILLNESAKRALHADWLSNPFENAVEQLDKHCEIAIESATRHKSKSTKLRS